MIIHFGAFNAFHHAIHDNGDPVALSPNPQHFAQLGIVVRRFRCFHRQCSLLYCVVVVLD